MGLDSMTIALIKGLIKQNSGGDSVPQWLLNDYDSTKVGKAILAGEKYKAFGGVECIKTHNALLPYINQYDGNWQEISNSVKYKIQDAPCLKALSSELKLFPNDFVIGDELRWNNSATEPTINTTKNMDVTLNQNDIIYNLIHLDNLGKIKEFYPLQGSSNGVIDKNKKINSYMPKTAIIVGKTTTINTYVTSSYNRRLFKKIIVNKPIELKHIGLPLAYEDNQTRDITISLYGRSNDATSIYNLVKRYDSAIGGNYTSFKMFYFNTTLTAGVYYVMIEPKTGYGINWGRNASPTTSISGITGTEYVDMVAGKDEYYYIESPIGDSFNRSALSTSNIPTGLMLQFNSLEQANDFPINTNFDYSGIQNIDCYDRNIEGSWGDNQSSIGTVLER